MNVDRPQALSEMPELVDHYYGIKLRETLFTDRMVVDVEDGIGYYSALYGPYRDCHNSDVRIWVNYRELRGSQSISLVVQDKDDDAFLNSNAEGAEQYDRSPVTI